MRCLVLVKFLPGGSIAPDQLFSHLNADWGWYDEYSEEITEFDENEPVNGVRSAVCVADYDTVQQLAIDLSVMPGAGIGGIEVIPVPDVLPEDDYIGQISVSSRFN